MRFLFGILLGLLILPLRAQELPDSVRHIREVEVRATRIFLPGEAGMHQSRLDTAILDEKSSVNLSELLSENTSVFIKNHGRGAMATASFRGTAASHTQVSWNGMNLNSPMLGMVDFSLIPVYLIDDLQLKHGAASISDRGGGIGGSISIGNRPSWGLPFRLRLIQGLGSYGTFDEFLQVEGGGKKLRLSTRLYHNQSRNDFSYLNRSIASIDPENGSLVHPMDTNLQADYSRYGLLQELYWRPGERQLLSLSYWLQRSDRAIPWPISYEGPDNANLNRQYHDDHMMVMQWQAYYPAGKISFRSGFAHRDMDYVQWKQVPGLGKISDVASVSRQQSLQNQLTYRHSLGKDWSVEARVDYDLHRVDTRDTLTLVGYAQQRGEISFFAALRKSFAGRLNMNLMFRKEWIDGKGVGLIPFAGFDLKLLDDGSLVLKGSVARNYHHPTLNDLYWQPGGNPDLLAEEGFSLEAGLDFNRQLGEIDLESSLSLYRSDIQNWIIWIPSGNMYLEPMNVKRVLSYGSEYALKITGDAGSLHYLLSGTYAFSPSINMGDPLVWGDDSYGKQLPYVPLHSGNLLLSVSYKAIFASYQYNAYSERFTTSSNDPSSLGWIYPYFMNDLSLGVRFSPGRFGVSLELKVYNLFNESYHSVLYRPMPGRNYLLVLKFDFK